MKIADTDCTTRERERERRERERDEDLNSAPLLTSFAAIHLRSTDTTKLMLIGL